MIKFRRRGSTSCCRDQAIAIVWENSMAIIGICTCSTKKRTNLRNYAKYVFFYLFSYFNDSKKLFLPYVKKKKKKKKKDRTTEVFMKGLDEKIMRLFFSEAYDRHGVVTPALIDAAFPPPSETGARVHAALEQALAEQPNASSSFLAEKCIRALLNLEELFPG